MLKTKLSTVAFSVAVMATALVTTSAMAEQKADTKFVDDSSYALGVFMGKNVEQMLASQKKLLTYNQEKILAGFEDTLKNKSKLNEEDLKMQLEDLGQYLAEKEEAMTLKAGKEFRDSYAKKAGVKQTKSGLLYKIEQLGKGNSPKLADTVKVHYEGTLTNGTVFDSSYQRGEPIEFQLSELIPAWKEAIPMLKKGGKMELVVPPELGYGDHQAGSIPANSTLMFKIELLDFKSTEAKTK
ncbi:FKBP-type peptidyl-prolyl cis-trans isomerase [Pasteurella skyensis]|uniref:Peptidyl-prolyl cis-trans isomerase n=1 Tax=Phocoenobacter skyensis TaxID=97481 RepID=A0AAJ6NAX1_9PAST|nr:FKBP-type peptidyl-prolyl cis-trans isomerase [Pasteurella skyensis]MDP8162690.1 FKBP-type peptidyl-prolyl cis-trans isomerase [Pasteurella skyensis]MDP8173458.1 FKBP-type peptidyl-prolyl cis-trans isomerase [Pasteurella skyensis]MDP8177623.1 FKBP-type peptidyl-prolyl cis-trans isomerase [Pasteurella skyensis]MDP8178792.1 FKBP-type peptidyl-prolyl cis-trans isomerase [Pasteurella skyensis]MDP8183092.1 FKBP-type peptidyl-prolyl cis-trans isomerase [Pasteurella skyensis]